MPFDRILFCINNALNCLISPSNCISSIALFRDFETRNFILKAQLVVKLLILAWTISLILSLHFAIFTPFPVQLTWTEYCVSHLKLTQMQTTLTILFTRKILTFCWLDCPLIKCPQFPDTLNTSHAQPLIIFLQSECISETPEPSTEEYAGRQSSIY